MIFSCGFQCNVYNNYCTDSAFEFVTYHVTIAAVTTAAAAVAAAAAAAKLLTAPPSTAAAHNR